MIKPVGSNQRQAFLFLAAKEKPGAICEINPGEKIESKGFDLGELSNDTAKVLPGTQTSKYSPEWIYPHVFKSGYFLTT